MTLHNFVRQKSMMFMTMVEPEFFISVVIEKEVLKYRIYKTKYFLVQIYNFLVVSEVPHCLDTKACTSL